MIRHGTTPDTARRRIFALLALLILLTIGAVVVVHHALHASPASQTATAARTASSTPENRASRAPFHPLTPPQIAELPEAKYDAVIPGLISYNREAPMEARTAYTLAGDTPVYGDDKITPVARLAGKNFLNGPTVVTPVAVSQDWSMVLTPARQTLPSASDGWATPQTAGWVRTDALHNPVGLTHHIVVSVGKQELSIVGDSPTQQFSVGVGAPGTPTPTDVTGYIQARYLDPTQGQSVYPIQLTSLHAAASDEPYSGHDGGLIGIHFYPKTGGDVSHGCIRLPAAAITAVTALPLGTLVTITP